MKLFQPLIDVTAGGFDRDPDEPAVVPQTIWHQVIARLLMLFLGWGAMEVAKDISKLGSAYLATGLGPNAKLPHIATPGQWKRAQIARIAEVTEPDDDAGDGAVAACPCRFEDGFGNWRDCEGDAGHTDRHWSNTIAGYNIEKLATFNARQHAEELAADAAREAAFTSEDLPYADELGDAGVHPGLVAAFDEDGQLHEQQHAETEG